jgi:hypothetical protein
MDRTETDDDVRPSDIKKSSAVDGTENGHSSRDLHNHGDVTQDSEEPDQDVSKDNVTFREKWKDSEYRRKCMRTLWLGASFWALVSEVISCSLCFSFVDFFFFFFSFVCLFVFKLVVEPYKPKHL